MKRKELIDFLKENDGRPPEGHTWFEVGLKFSILPPDAKRAQEDDSYFCKSIAKRTQDIWRRYLKDKEKLSLTKEVYKEGKLLFETYKKEAESISFDEDGFAISSITTSPYGGAWTKYKKAEKPLNEEQVESLLEILQEKLDITPIEYKVEVNSITDIGDDIGLFVYGADKHIGALTKENSIYRNAYDKQTMEKRIVNETIFQIENVVCSYGPLKDLFIMDLGDALDGYNQQTTRKLQERTPHFLPQQLNNREQHDTYVYLHKKLFDYIVEKKYAENIYFIATSNSNHGGDFEYTAMKTLEMYLNMKYPFIKTCITTKFLDHFIYGEHCIIFSHGKDTEDLKKGFPIFLDNKSESFISEYIRVNNLSGYNISFISADLHQSSEYYSKGFRYKKVLSQYGSSKWIHTNFGSTPSGLSSEIFFKNTGLIYKSDRLFLEKNVTNTGFSIN